MRLAKRIVRFLLALIRSAVWLIGLATLLVMGWLYVAQQPLPRQTLTRLLDTLSTDTTCVDANRASVGLREGIVLHHVRLLPKHLIDPPWMTADELRIVGSIHPGRPPREWLESVVAHSLTIPTLPACKEDNESTVKAHASSQLQLAELPPMHFDIVDANFAGMHFKRLQGNLRQDAGATIIENVHIEWSSEHWTEEAQGDCRYDSETGHLEGHIIGHTVPERIYPLLRMLHANDVEAICRRFAFSTTPVDVETRFCVAPESPQMELRITLSTYHCTYNDVPVQNAHAVIVASGSNAFDRVVIQPLVCQCENGLLSGSLVYDTRKTNLDVLAQSNMPLAPLFRIIGLSDGMVPASVHFITPPKLTITGRVALEGSSEYTHLTGTLAASTATVFRLPVETLQAGFGIISNRYMLSDVQAVVAGGEVTGDLTLLSPINAVTQTTYRTSFRLHDVNMETLSTAFGATNPIPGKASGEIELDGPLPSGTDQNLHGKGDVRIQKGAITRIPLFAGFTDYLAHNVPGVNSIVSQTEAHIPFAITNGLLRTDGALVEGNVFSLTGKGTYNFPTDQVDFSVQASIFKRRTWLGTISRIVTFPFAKLLMEFRVTGSANHPAWEYRGILERIIDSVGDAVGNKKDTQP